jgi:hypothetical protein
VKRGLVQAMSVSVICVAAALWTPLPAIAKGPSLGVITGPGLAYPIRLREPGARTIGLDLAKVVTQSGFSVGMWGGDRDRLAHRPAGDLGPRYTITYNMTLSDRLTGTIVQYVFPYAEPLPITYMPAKQKYWGGQETVGAWYTARIGLRQTLIGLGLPTSGSSQPAAGSDAGTSAVPSPAGSIGTPFLVATAVLALALVALLMRRHRLRRSVLS